MEKKQKIARKKLQRIKNNNKHTRLNIHALRREVYAYQFHFAGSTPAPWIQSFTRPREHDSITFKAKDQHRASPEIKT